MHTKLAVMSEASFRFECYNIKLILGHFKMLNYNSDKNYMKP